MALILFFSVAFLIHLAERRWPLRVYDHPPALKIDISALLLAFVIKGILSTVEEPWVIALPDKAGFEWLARLSELVATNVPGPLTLVASLVAIDFLGYCAHRLLHTRHLWHTHAAHHSSVHLYWLAGVRASPFHQFFITLGGTLVPLVVPLRSEPLVFCSLFMAVLFQHFNHANLRWGLGPVGWLIVAPKYHFVHHGAAREHNDRNFGFLLTIWDRLFGTYMDPDSVGNEFPLGLSYPLSTARMFIGLPPKKEPS